MSKNRFEQVDEPTDDAIALTLMRRDETTIGTVQCPGSATRGLLPKGFSSGEMPAGEAFRSAIKLANEMKVPIVVIDAEKAWDPKWGHLFRDTEEGPGEEKAGD